MYRDTDTQIHICNTYIASLLLLDILSKRLFAHANRGPIKLNTLVFEQFPCTGDHLCPIPLFYFHSSYINHNHTSLLRQIWGWPTLNYRWLDVSGKSLNVAPLVCSVNSFTFGRMCSHPWRWVKYVALCSFFLIVSFEINTTPKNKKCWICIVKSFNLLCIQIIR